MIHFNPDGNQRNVFIYPATSYANKRFLKISKPKSKEDIR
jgi:hypothetical protein